MALCPIRIASTRVVPTPQKGSKTLPLPSRYLFKASLTNSLENPAIQGTHRWIGNVLLLAKAGSLKTELPLLDSEDDCSASISNSLNCFSCPSVTVFTPFILNFSSQYILYTV